jgi:two-component system sensor histidine kinase KdpD
MTETPSRPDPDRLLAAVAREEARARRGRLRTFFGASAGVGKTYAMLEAAHNAGAKGVDVVVGYVEPHGRAETERLLQGLERLPTLPIRHRGIVLQEFDLDAALRRRAAITLVDELAHSNLVEGAPQPRHAKRWQDIEEMLDAGLDVWTTVNVQHLESLNDVIAGITGVRQQETVPDRIFDDADEIELIDLPPDDLLQRLRDGKVYVPEQAQAALERFFRKPNLMALRELALRRTADRVDAAAREYVGRGPVSRPWLARDRFLVGVAPDEQAEHLVRFAKRFADSLDAEWTVVSVETPAMLRLGEAERNRRIDVLRLAESLGAETVTLDGPAPGPVILEYARVRNASRIVVGEPRRHGWRSWFRPTTATFLTRRPHGIDVTVVAKRDEAGGGRPARSAVLPAAARSDGAEIRWDRYGWAVGTSAAATLVGVLMDPHFSVTNIVMVYLLGALVAGLRFGRGPATLAAVLNIACFNFFFVPPRLTFAVSDVQYLVTFAVMLGVALTIATLAANVRQQTRVAGARERRTAMLYAMSRELAAARGIEAMRELAVKHVSETFGSRVAVLVPNREARFDPVAGSDDPRVYEAADPSIAQWVYDKRQPAGLGTDTLPGAPAIYLPLVGTQRSLGVIAILPSNRRRVLLPEQRHLLETFAGQVALAIERTQMAEAAEVARVAAETETLRNTLLASISHDIRTPLAVIAGASSALTDSRLQLDEAARARLARSIEAKARDVSELVSNVLDLMRFGAGHIPLRRDWETLDDLVGIALSRLEGRLHAHVVKVELPDDLPAIDVDAGLITQVLSNLLDNAVRHTPPGTHVTITARVRGADLEISVEDDGQGLPPGDPDRLFVKFQRGREEGEGGGAGLGLAICRAIIEAHDGEIHAASLPQGGARFDIRLPIGGAGA